MTQTPPPAADPAAPPPVSSEADASKTAKSAVVSGKTIGAAVGIGSAAIVAALLFVNRKK